MPRPRTALPAAALALVALAGCGGPAAPGPVNAGNIANAAAAFGAPAATSTTAASDPASPSSASGAADATTTTATTPSSPAPSSSEAPATTTTTQPPVAPTSTPAQPPKQETPAQPPRTTQAPAPQKSDVEIAEEKVVALTNEQRKANNCPAVTADARLGKAARAHSADMAAQNYFSHVSKDGRSFVDRIKAAGHPSPGAENIAAGQRTPEDVMKSWMDSEGHRANILNCGLKTLGVGMAKGGSYGIYWTQNFGW
ncbi:CAP domain-containing protein [Actinosynnema sp.]|uniref:CAP domain-containing protein n=1 Tax=Actinosynnema sp. TaxID=1872144 RepID=UPI003F831EB2